MGKKKHKKKAKAQAWAHDAATPATGATPPSVIADQENDTAVASAPSSDVSRETPLRGPSGEDHLDVGPAAPGPGTPHLDPCEPTAAPPPPATARPSENDSGADSARRVEPGSPVSPSAAAGPRRAVARDTLPRPVAAPRILVVANQKGGVGKTTTAVNVAAALALGGLRVLLVDLDPQGNASTALGVEHGPDVAGTYEALIDGQDIADLVRPSPEADTLQVLPASIHLAGAEIQLVGMVAREGKLAKAIRRYVRDHDVDYVFLDCPPSLGLLTVNALVAADEIMIPIQCEYYALEGVSQLMNTIELVKGELNDDLQLSTVLLTMFDARTRLAAQVVDEVRTHFAAETLAAVIPRSVRISEAPSYGRTVMTYDPESTGARSYHAAAAEIAHRGARP